MDNFKVCKMEDMMREDRARRRSRRRSAECNPLEGRKVSYARKVWICTPEPEVPRALVPATLVDDADFERAQADPALWRRLRSRHDFEYWCFRCVVIKHKTTGQDVPFVLNRAQRKLLDVLESQRTRNLPLRVILLKARQWGGSTLVQVYMAWIQSCHKRNWHSLICAHVKDTSATIRGMYTNLLAHYPADLWEGTEAPQFKAYERTLNVRVISGRGCRVTISSSENQDAVRGADYAMAHLSETAFWKSTPQRSPEDYIRAVCGSVPTVPLSLIVMESTANGVANYFHSEWLRSVKGESDKTAVFVPWYMIDIYTLEPPDRKEFARSLDAYEKGLWDLGLDLDQIYWYRIKRRGMGSDERMHAEFPTTDTEAFTSTGCGVFTPAGVNRLRGSCCEPTRTVRLEPDSDGRIAAVDDPRGGFQIWKLPQPGSSYVTGVDVGGRSEKSDWSVIVVIRQPDNEDDRAEVVAQWRGHCDHDRVADKAEMTGLFYNNALLVIESNTFETDYYGGTSSLNDGSSAFVLNRLAERYPNVYTRESFDTLTNAPSRRVGFHTNRATKAILIGELIRNVRDGLFIERCDAACDELLTYEQRANGSYGAKVGYHDDMLMARALSLHVATQLAPAPAGDTWQPWQGW